MSFRIRAMKREDTSHLPAIEQSAGELFRTIADLAWIADGENLSEQRHVALLEGGACWVAELENGNLAAFLSAETARDALHIWELSVLRDQQRQGIGHALLAEAIAFARAKTLAAITLSTFREVPWNECMYHRLGFETLQPNECDLRLAGILDLEIAAGLPGERRCAMRLRLDRRSPN